MQKNQKYTIRESKEDLDKWGDLCQLEDKPHKRCSLFPNVYTSFMVSPNPSKIICRYRKDCSETPTDWLRLFMERNTWDDLVPLCLSLQGWWARGVTPKAVGLNGDL